MTSWLCETCGVQFAESVEPPPRCPICEDERQYVPVSGQRWTTLEELRLTHRNEIRDDFGLVGIGCEPSFAIGQRALIVPSDPPILWDCVPLLDVGLPHGLLAIAVDHPHFYSSMVEWAERFDCPIYLHAADREWVMRPNERIVFWDGDTQELAPGVTLIRLGGHFAGGTVLHWREGNALLSSDIVTVVADRRWVSFMYSYPNLIPLPAGQVRRMVAALEPYEFDRVYGGWWDRVVASDGKAAIRRSAERYIRALEG